MAARRIGQLNYQRRPVFSCSRNRNFADFGSKTVGSVWLWLYQVGKNAYHRGLLLDIRFKNKKVRELCEKASVAERKLGPDCARKLRVRLAALEAANSVTDLVAGRPHGLTGDRDGQFALDLAGGRRLVFAPANDPIPHKPDGSTDWSRVTIVSIEYIGDYHD